MNDQAEFLLGIHRCRQIALVNFASLQCHDVRFESCEVFLSFSFG